jgi:hypothetical protein
MTNRYTGGVISATAPTVSQSGASGVWNLEEAQYYQKAGLWPPGSGADPYFQNTTLLLHGDGTNGAQNNSFVDSSVNNFTITRNGNTTQGAFNPYVGPGCWSNYFDGTGDYLTFPQTALQFSTNDFTVEAWVYFSAIATDQYIFNYASSGPTHVGINYYSGAWRIGGFNSYLVTGGTASAGQWYHVAMVRSANNLRAYINGTQIGSTVSVSGVTFSASGVGYIGAYYLSGSNLNGLISNLRITKGVALYTSAFTPSTTPLVATTQTILLTCNNNGFIDQSAANNTLTRNGGTQVSKFSPFTLYQVTPTSYSGYFDGTGDYLTAPASNSTIWPGSGSFTIEYWLYLPANPSAGYYTHFSYGTAGSVLRVFNTAATSKIEVFSGASVILNPAWPTAGQWNHFALVRNGTTLTLYINGAVAQSVTNSTDFSTGTLTIGGESASNPLLGSISNFRIVKGTAVYTSAFTPPTSPLTAISGTSLLTCQSTTFIDNSTNAFTITAFGNATPKRANPFTDTVTGPTSYTGSTYAGSAYFDGSGDYLTLTGSSNLAFGLNNFTIEVWIYPTVAADRMIYDGRPNSITGPYPTLYIGATNQVFYYTIGANRIVGGTIQYYAWNHIALVRSSGTTRLYLNGALLGSYVDATNYANGAARPIIGADGGNVATLNMLGYLSNLRVVNGTAVYTGPFVPPTAPVTAVSGTQLLVNATNAGIFDNTTVNDLETIGSAQVNTTIVKYGTGSMYFNGLSDALIMASQPAITFGTGDFTVEGWVYFAGAPASTFHSLYSTLVQLASPGDHGVLIRASTTKLIAILQADNATTLTLTSTNNVTTGQWYHFALTRSGTTARLFLDGTLEASGTSSVNFYETAQALGRVYATSTGTTQYLNGYLDDVRVTKGVARYTANFTPPAAAFPNF